MSRSHVFLGFALALALALSPSSLAAAQEAPIAQLELPYHLDSGTLASPLDRPEVVFSRTIQVEGAPWIRLAFQHVRLAGDPGLGQASKLVMTSLRDGAVQELDAEHVEQWQHSSAYFNGDAVQLDLLAQPGTGGNRVVLRAVWVGIPGGPDTQCGPTDDRQLSSDPRAGRALPIGCSAWIFDDCNHCLGTAGHCSGSSLQTIEFNVPMSTSGGSLVHPSPDHQYAVDVSSKQSVSGGVGNDWGYFGCFPNSNTGLTPFQKQGQSYALAASPPAFSSSHVIRITGYGTDSTPNNTYNQVQQTSTGPYFSFSGSTVRYTVDTQGGNSGSPVIWENGGGVVIGVHTHGGCQTGNPPGGNSGTGTNHAGWDAALAAPIGVCNTLGSVSFYCTAKVNSLGCTPAIAAVGLPKESGAPGSFLIQTAQQISQKSVLLFYGYLPSAQPFQGGILCVAQPVIRTPVGTTGGSASGTDCSGAYSYDMAGLIASGTDPGLTCGAIVYGQMWSRDPGFAPPNNTSLTRGVRFQIGM